MKPPVEAHQMPARIATGAFILSSGLDKRGADEETAQGLHGMAAGAYPFLNKIEPVPFAKLVSASEIALGTALLLPVVPTKVAAAGLTAFGAAFVGLYLRTPGMRRPNSIRPSEEGLAIAKDVWMFGAGLSLLLDPGRKRGEARPCSWLGSKG
ncbi:hypothetical protein [Nocardiopsis salina]|uniref:hypothetical protein n=1 Tax=Nocardiopsis salina TaxID=245836 RepID=UPI00035EC397|nr:hypothetical protein [Nocardiopsis salina]